MDTALLELREQVVTASRAGEALRLHGGRTKDFYTAAEPLSGRALDLRGYRGIVAYEPSELVITARCGTPLREIEDVLSKENQFLAFEPPAFGGEPTLGGAMAAGLSGPRRMQAGPARDFVLGATLLAADGEELRFGGQVMKNVAGFDVSRLLCGSLGILGIVTEWSIKVLPMPRAEQTRRLELPLREALESFNRWCGQPLPISAAAWYEGGAWLRLSGAASAVRAAGERIGGEHVPDDEAQQWWDGLRHCTHPLFRQPSVWRLSVPAIAPPLPLAGQTLIDWGGALRWHAGDSGPLEGRAAASAAGGTAWCWRGAAPEGRFHPLSAAVTQIHRRLKRHFDPHGIFNPGRLLAQL